MLSKNEGYKGYKSRNDYMGNSEVVKRIGDEYVIEIMQPFCYFYLM